MHRFFRNLTAVAISLICCALIWPPDGVRAAERLQNVGEKIVIVIDPGHGGENLGTIENGHEEKGMTLITAKAMYDELLLYDNVEVYLTRTDDREVYIKDRAIFAEEVEADFLFSIHYNASITHEVFGSEVWVSAFAPYNAYGYQFGCEFLSLMKEKGLFIRGVKTRLGSKGNDYYGIIRESAERGVPAVILEHCHVDQEGDAAFCSDEEKLKEFGRADATAAARYFGLKSETLQVDYSGHRLAEAQEDKSIPITMSDLTEPEICLIEPISEDFDRGILTLSVSAADYDTALLYYSYSLDGGETFCPRKAWPECDAVSGRYPDTFTLELEIPPGTRPRVAVRAYNTYDLCAQSDVYQSPGDWPERGSGANAPSDASGVSGGGEDSSVPAGAFAAGTTPLTTQESEDPQTEVLSKADLLGLLQLALVFAILLLALLILVQYLGLRRRRKRAERFAAQIRNEEGDTRYQQR